MAGTLRLLTWLLPLALPPIVPLRRPPFRPPLRPLLRLRCVRCANDEDVGVLEVGPLALPRRPRRAVPRRPRFRRETEPDPEPGPPRCGRGFGVVKADGVYK